MTVTPITTTIALEGEDVDPRALLELWGTPTALFDECGRVLDLNARLLELTGRALDEVVGREPPHPWWSMRGWEAGDIAGGEFAVSIVGGADGEVAMRCVIAAIPPSASSRGRWIAILAPPAAARDGDGGRGAGSRHAGRVADLVERMARALGWDSARIVQLRRAALLHDAGSVSASDPPLLGPEQASWVRHHHERYDGEGRPDGLVGPRIPEGARLIAVADAFDVLVSGRPDARARSRDEARGEIRSLSGIQFAPRAVAALDMALATSGRSACPS